MDWLTPYILYSLVASLIFTCGYCYGARERDAKARRDDSCDPYGMGR